MLLSLTDLQAMIETSVVEFLDHEYDFLKRRDSLKSPDGINPLIWNSFAEMGWLGLPVAEEQGGIGGGVLESGLLMRAFGQRLVLEPFHNNVLLATRLLAECGRTDQQENWLPQLIQGKQRLALAHDEPANPDPWAPRKTRAITNTEGFCLTGRKTLVAGAPGASGVLLSAYVEVPGGGHQALFLLPIDTPGVSLNRYTTLDGGHAADLLLNEVQVGQGALLGSSTDCAAKLQEVIAGGIVDLCWEASGAMQAVLQQTIGFTQERVQFGKSISSFQVVQHRLAEMAVCCEEALAVCQLAALRIQRDPSCATTVASLAKSKVGRGARYVAQEAVQLHGAMGVSDELAIPSYFRKLLAFTQQAGSTAWHSERYGALMLDSGDWRESQSLPTSNA